MEPTSREELFEIPQGTYARRMAGDETGDHGVPQLLVRLVEKIEPPIGVILFPIPVVQACSFSFSPIRGHNAARKCPANFNDRRRRLTVEDLSMYSAE